MGRRKDAQWQYAYELAAKLGLSFETCTEDEWTVLLAKAEDFLEKFPEAEDRLTRKWRNDAL